MYHAVYQQTQEHIKIIHHMFLISGLRWYLYIQMYACICIYTRTFQMKRNIHYIIQITIVSKQINQLMVIAVLSFGIRGKQIIK